MPLNVQLLQEIITRLMEDPEYRDTFFLDPQTTLSAYTLNASELSYLLGITDLASLQESADALAVPATIRSGSKGVEETAAPDSGSEPDEGQIVSTGFATQAQPDRPIAGTMPLAANTSHYFWVEIGAAAAGSIETSNVPLPSDLPDGAELQIALFPFRDELALRDGQDVGVLRLVAGGQAEVAKPAAVPTALIGGELLRHRLFFPVRSPAAPGDYRLRCNIYYQQVLLQSRLVTMRVAVSPTSQAEQVLRSDLDYTLSTLRNGRQLTNLEPNRLSIMINDNGSGSHGFRFFGGDNQEQYKNDVSLDGNTLQNLIEQTRKALRTAAWGDADPFTNQKKYRYEGSPSLDRLKGDLVELAKWGTRFYAALSVPLAGGGGSKQRELRQLLRQPGRIQIATKQNARLLVPSAILYDYKLNPNLPPDAYTLCSTFTAALKDHTPLADSPCFRGNCPHADDLTAVCPSGFWGYRHELGLPVSVVPGQDAPVTIATTGTPTMSLSICTDKNFVLRDDHLQRMQAWQLGWEVADSLTETIALLQQRDAQVVYFYCHGGEFQGIPFLLVGDPLTETGFTADNLGNFDIFWEAPRPQPLVFINGCHTTAVEPDNALDFVTGFVQTAEAAGVIGTEITIFEAIAVKFAEACLHAFLVERQSIGTAVRYARLAMLQEMNPLGLAYIPYVMPSLRLAG